MDPKQPANHSDPPAAPPSSDAPVRAEIADQPTAGRVVRWRRVWVLGLLVAAIAITFGIALGGTATYWLVQRGMRDGGVAEADGEAEAAPTIWTCSMHPQIRMPEPGQCPICYMDLIPLEDDNDVAGPRQLRMSEAGMALAEIRTEPVRRQYATRNVRMVGKVDYDETRLANITAWVPGRIERLYVDFTGVTVRRGDHLFSLYSPELIVAQRELLQALRSWERRGGEGSLVDSTLHSAREKLRLLGLRPEQIAEIEAAGAPVDELTIYAPAAGTVTQRHVNEGMYVQQGTPVYTIADLAVVWARLEAYEQDLPWLRYGQEVEFTTESHPGEVFHGRIAFIDPILDERTRTVRLRVNVENPDGRLKPGMFMRATVRSRMAAGGEVFEPALIGKWISPMHPEIVKDGPGQCDICGMDLVPAEELGYAVPERTPEQPLLIPATAPLITGRRAVVYVRLPHTEEPTFEGREVLLGPRAGDDYIVRYGLEEGELVVVQGNFKIDSALQIQARPSMMGPEEILREEAEVEPLPVPIEVRVALNPAHEAYLEAAWALAEDDEGRAREALARLGEVLIALEHPELEEEMHERLQHLSDRAIIRALDAAEAPRLRPLRRLFAEVSEAMISLAQEVGHALEADLVRVHSPLALDGRGADWLQAEGAIRNPYLGPAMLDAGEEVAHYPSQIPLEVPEEFRRQLAGVYHEYLDAQTALADDRLEDARAALDGFLAALDEPQSAVLEGRSAEAWAMLHEALHQAAHEAHVAEDFEPMREPFEPLSEAMLELADRFGHPLDADLTQAYCPMAFDNRGAAWLQEGETIDNPYFGHAMRRCGAVQHRFPPGEPDGSTPRPVGSGSPPSPSPAAPNREVPHVH